MKLFVRNLSFELEDEDLKKIFEKVGEVVSAKVITDRYTGKSRGFGFVEMPDRDSGQKAINELHGENVNGREIEVTEAHDKRK